jgi:hypothetical protein
MSWTFEFIEVSVAPLAAHPGILAVLRPAINVMLLRGWLMRS